MARSSRYLVICLKNDGDDVSLERRKIYVAIPDVSAPNMDSCACWTSPGTTTSIPVNILHPSNYQHPSDGLSLQRHNPAVNRTLRNKAAQRRLLLR